ncbi:MAG: DNA primase [Euryarchaeota archaeon]|jgi:DNA primase|nr:DNA primase [Euryarchaeota archaeon]MBT4803313.1 DNA primase [Euryarchaeota archaeon]MBT5614535.1 DNA primase [Euryarchaeota archaeon]MBT6683832.1 DNA primase [Euryarchaeota archaeon]MBT6873941.1 DNA primase [Euryarchaeota archaeon]
MSNEGKYVIHASIRTDGTVARKDVIGAIFGQTEGLLGDQLQLRKLQRTGRIGHVDVVLHQNKGKVQGEILVTSSLDQVSTSVIGAALETIERIGPCKSSIKVKQIENIRSAKRDHVIDRAKELLVSLVNSGTDESKNILEEVRSVLTLDTEIEISGMTAGPNVENSEAIIIVEGRNDVRNLLKYGIKNAIATMGSGINSELLTLASKKKIVTAFLDGDRGGKLLLMELSGKLGKSLTHVSIAPQSREVEHLEGKVITKCLNQKEVASKAVARIQIEIQKDDDETVGTGSELLEAPEHVKKWAELLEGLPRNNAVIILEDGTTTDPIGARSLKESLEETKGAQGLVFAGKINDKIFDYASGAGIENVLGNSRGKVSRKQDVQAFSPDDF